MVLNMGEKSPTEPQSKKDTLFLSSKTGASPYTIDRFLSGGVNPEDIQDFLGIIECFSNGMGKKTIADRRDTGMHNIYQVKLETLILAYHQYGGSLEELQILFESVIDSIGEGPVSEVDGRGQKIYDRALRKALGIYDVEECKE